MVTVGRTVGVFLQLDTWGGADLGASETELVWTLLWVFSDIVDIIVGGEGSSTLDTLSFIYFLYF